MKNLNLFLCIALIANFSAAQANMNDDALSCKDMALALFQSNQENPNARTLLNTRLKQCQESEMPQAIVGTISKLFTQPASQEIIVNTDLNMTQTIHDITSTQTCKGTVSIKLNRTDVDKDLPSNDSLKSIADKQSNISSDQGTAL